MWVHVETHTSGIRAKKYVCREDMAVYCFKRPRYIAQHEEPAEKRPRVEPSGASEETGKVVINGHNIRTGNTLTTPVSFSQ